MHDFFDAHPDVLDRLDKHLRDMLSHELGVYDRPIGNQELIFRL